MAWKYRSAHLAPLALGAAFVANCSSTPPPPQGDTTTGGSAGGASAVSGPGAGTTDGSGGIPVLDSGSATGTGGIPVLDSGSASSTTSSNGGSGTVTTGTDGTVTTGAGMTTTGTDGTTTTGSGGTGSGGTTLATIRVSAGQFDRDHSIVKFEFPEGADHAKSMVLVDSGGAQIPLQYSSATGNASFILESMAAGASADYTIEALASDLPAGVTYTNDTHLLYNIGDSTVFRWTLQVDNFRGATANNERRGYIYPLYTPAGLNVADDYQSDHPHMHGVWSAWTNTTFRTHHVDFWNGYADEGKVDLNSMAGVWDGPVHGGLIADLDHIDITTNPNVVVLTERWIVTIFKTHDGTQPYYVFDIDSVQATATSDPLTLEQYHYGGFGFRGAQEWTNTANVSFLTSEGDDRTSGDGQNGRWVAQYGDINGQTGGFAGLGHPDNFRAPQGLRIHPTNPYWAFVPCTALKGGRFELEGGGVPYHSQFRVVSFDGAADAAFLDQQWNDYATPPTVERL